MNKLKMSMVVLFVVVAGLSLSTRAELTEDQVLVVYNSQDADSLAVWNYYSSKRTGVVGFDLDDATLNPGTVTHADYVSKIRNPVRDFLDNSIAGGNGFGQDISSDIAVITLTKGIPHRISDTDNSDAGGAFGGGNGGAIQAGNEATANDATFSSVDSELTLLWQDLDSGEAGGNFDSPSDNWMSNPFYNSTQRITDYNRSTIKDTNEFLNNSAASFSGQEMRDFAPGPFVGPASDAGEMYLTSRLDGYTVADVQAMIDRGMNIQIQNNDAFLFDENSAISSGNLDDGDWDTTASDLQTNGYTNVTHDTSASFYIGEDGAAMTGSQGSRVTINGDVAFVAHYGGNHDGNGLNTTQEGWVNTFDGQLVNGAIMNSLESWNAVEFGGLSASGDQGQLAEWIAAGGTFGIGSAWEPFTFAIADNEILLDLFLNQEWTWVEASWAALPYVSWPQIVIGDPLATIPEPASLVLIFGTGTLILLRRHH